MADREQSMFLHGVPIRKKWRLFPTRIESGINSQLILFLDYVFQLANDFC